MDTKTILHGAGVYYFAFKGAKQQRIFNSVFEYAYAEKILSTAPNSRLLAYVFTPEQLFCVLRCEDSLASLQHIQASFDEQYYRIWKKQHSVLAEETTIMLIDEQAFLVDTILQLHDWPRYSGLVADGSLWPHSSDKYYRSSQPPAWLDTSSMLNLLAHSRRNRHMHYANVTTNPLGNKLDLLEGNQTEVLALARDKFIQHFNQTLPQAFSLKKHVNSTELFAQACELVAAHFAISVAELKDPLNRRRFHHLMPLVVWLLRLRQVPFDDIAKLCKEDEVRLGLWLRNIEIDHTENTKQKLLSSWG